MAIKTVQQCQAVQKRRIAAGKFGYSKAVRRRCMQDHDLGTQEGYDAYRAELTALPAIWSDK